MDFIRQELVKYIGILSKVKNIHDSRTRLLIYNAFIYPHFVYGIELFGHANEITLRGLAKLQRKFIRLIVGIGYCDSTAQHFENLGVLKISQLFRYRIMIFLYKLIHCNQKSSNIEFVQEHLGRSRRAVQRLRPIQIFNPFGTFIIEYFGSIMWNKAPDWVIQVDKISLLKRNCKAWKELFTIDIYKST